MRQGISIMLLCAAVGCTAPPVRKAPPENTRAALLVRASADQALRDTMMTAMRSRGGGLDSLLQRRIRALDSSHTFWLRRELPASGWFQLSEVGADGMSAAFLLVQHATDTSVQARVLPALRAAVDRGEVTGQDFALLSDRIVTQRGVSQEFGTQAELRDGRFVFFPIADSACVDTRRARIGLMPLVAYARFLDSLYLGSSSVRAP